MSGRSVYRGNVLWGGLRLTVGALSTPLLVRALPDPEAAAWFWLVAYSGVLGLAELGIGGAALSLSSSARSEGRSVSSVLWPIVRAYLLVVVPVALASSAVVVAAGLGRPGWLPVDDFRTLTVAATALTVLRMGAMVLSGLYGGCVDFLGASRILGVGGLATSSLLVVAAVAYRRVEALAVVSGVAQAAVLTAFVVALVLARRRGQLAWPDPRPEGAVDGGDRPPVARRAMAYWPTAISSASFGSLDRLVVGSVLSPAMFVVYSLITSAAGQITRVSGLYAEPIQLIGARYAAAGRADHRPDLDRPRPEELRKLGYRNSVIVGALLALTLGPGFVVIHAVVGPVGTWPQWWAAASSFALFSLSGPSVRLLQGAGQARAVASGLFWASVAYVGVLLVAVNWFGLWGALVANAAYAVQLVNARAASRLSGVGAGSLVSVRPLAAQVAVSLGVVVAGEALGAAGTTSAAACAALGGLLALWQWRGGPGPLATGRLQLALGRAGPVSMATRYRSSWK